MYFLSLEITVPLIIFVGFFTAIIASLIGLGGGIIAIPLILLVIGIDKNLEAKLISYVSILALSIFSLIKYTMQKKRPTWMKMGLITLGVIPSTMICELYLGKILAEYEMYFHVAYAILIALVIILINIKDSIKKHELPLWSLPLFGLLIGVFSGGMGISGGVLFIPLLVIGLSMNLKEAAVNAIFLKMFAAFANIIIASSSGQYSSLESHGVYWFLPLIIIVGSIPGSLIGPIISKRINQQQIRLTFNAVMGILLLWEICASILMSHGIL